MKFVLVLATLCALATIGYTVRITTIGNISSIVLSNQTVTASSSWGRKTTREVSFNSVSVEKQKDDCAVQ